MKRSFTVLLALCLILAMALPLLALPDQQSAAVPNIPAAAEVADPPPAIPIKTGADGETVLLAAREYVFGVVAAEMPMSCHDEALKARAVAAYSYALYCLSESEQPLTAVPATHQAYITRAAAMEKWGERAEEYAARLDNITKETEGLYLSYGGEPALALCHAISSGRTADGSALGLNKPYLTAVESAGDPLSPKYRTVKAFNTEQFAELCRNGGITLGEEAADWLKTTDGGYLLGGGNRSAAEIQKLFGLPSPSFEITFSEGAFTFTCFGAGHGVGMSLNGANFMALCGSSYAEILQWYYPETKIEKL